MGIGWWEAILTPKQGERLIKVYEGRDSIYTLSLQEYGISKCAKCGGSDNLKVCPMVEVRYPTDPATNYTHFYLVREVACCIGCARFRYNICLQFGCRKKTDIHHVPHCSLHAWEGRGRAIELGKADRYNKEELERMSPKRLRDTLKREGLSSCNAAKSTLVNRYLKGEKKKKAMTPNERKRKSRANAKRRSEEDGLAREECGREAKRPLNHYK